MSQYICGRLKSPPIIKSGVPSMLLIYSLSLLIASLNSLLFEDLPWVESSGCLYTVAIHKFSFDECTLSVSNTLLEKSRICFVVAAMSSLRYRATPPPNLPLLFFVLLLSALYNS